MTKFRAQFDKRPVKDGMFPCDELLEGDGIDPRHDRDNQPVANRKALQLCSQVFNILNLTFAGMKDELVQESFVDSVVPAPDSTQLLVSVSSKRSPDEVFESLQKASGFLRREIASGITRKRVPQLKFVVKSY